MKVEDFLTRMDKFIKTLNREKGNIITIAAYEVLAEMQTRIFEEGKDSNGNDIGQYSTKPIYVPSPYPQVNNSGLKKVGKNGRKTKKTSYLKGGYKEFRQKAGRKTNRVNLDLTGGTRLAMNVGIFQSKKAIGFTTPLAVEIAEGNEGRYKKRIFKLTVKEREIFNKAVAREIRRIRKQTLGE